LAAPSRPRKTGQRGRTTRKKRKSRNKREPHKHQRLCLRQQRQGKRPKSPDAHERSGWRAVRRAARENEAPHFRRHLRSPAFMRTSQLNQPAACSCWPTPAIQRVCAGLK
jgi:hypothetical protein